MNFLDELQWRGLLKDVTNLDALTNDLKHQLPYTVVLTQQRIHSMWGTSNSSFF